MRLQGRLPAATAAAAAAAQPPSSQSTVQTTAADPPAGSTSGSLPQSLLQSKLSDPAAAACGTAEGNSPAACSAPDQSVGAGILSQLGITPLNISDADQV